MVRCRVIKIDDVTESYGIRIGDIVQYIEETDTIVGKRIVAMHNGRKCVFMLDELEHIRD